jgi:hypothetical protein
MTFKRKIDPLRDRNRESGSIIPRFRTMATAARFSLQQNGAAPYLKGGKTRRPSRLRDSRVPGKIRPLPAVTQAATN